MRPKNEAVKPKSAATTATKSNGPEAATRETRPRQCVVRERGSRRADENAVGLRQHAFTVRPVSPALGRLSAVYVEMFRVILPKSESIDSIMSNLRSVSAPFRRDQQRSPCSVRC